MLHVRSRSTFTRLHLRAVNPAGAARRLNGALRGICMTTTKVREKTVRPMDGVRDFGRHGLVQGNRSSMALNWMMLLLLFALTLQLLTLALFPLTVSHLLLLTVSLDQLLLPGISLAFSVDGLGGGMLHRLAEGRKRVPRIVRRRRGMLAVARRLVRSGVALAQLCQTREGVTGGLTRRMIGACTKRRVSQ